MSKVKNFDKIFLRYSTIVHSVGLRKKYGFPYTPLALLPPSGKKCALWGVVGGEDAPIIAKGTENGLYYYYYNIAVAGGSRKEIK